MQTKTQKSNSKTGASTANKTQKQQNTSGGKKKAAPATKKAKSSVPAKKKGTSNSPINKLYAAVPELKSGVNALKKAGAKIKEGTQKLVQAPGKMLSNFMDNTKKGSPESAARAKANEALRKQYENEEGYQTSQMVINMWQGNNPEFNRFAENFNGWLTGDYEKFYAGRDLAKKSEDLINYYKNWEGYNLNLFLYLDAEFKRARQEYYQKIEVRGELSQGATISPMLFAYRNGGRYEQNERALQNAENWIEKYPGLGIFGQYIGNLSDNAAKSLAADATNAGNKIYNMNIPFLSDFGAAMLGSDLDSGDSVGAATGGFFYGAGTAVLGAGKGLVDMASDPIQTARTINWLLNKPEESIPTIAKSAGEYINKNIINGNAESRGRAVGTLTAEIASFIVGAGGAKAAKTADTVADAGAAGNKLLRGVEKNIDNVMPGPGTIGMKPSPGVIGNLDDAVGARSWYDKLMNPLDNSQGVGKKVKISNKVDDVGKGGSGSAEAQIPRTGDEWHKYFNETYGKSNVTWESANINGIVDMPSKIVDFTPQQVAELAKTYGWSVEPLGKGSMAGVPFDQGGGFSMHAPNGGSEYIQYHPGGGHHGADAYYKISSGPNGTVRYNLNGGKIQ